MPLTVHAASGISIIIRILHCLHARQPLNIFHWSSHTMRRGPEGRMLTSWRHMVLRTVSSRINTAFLPLHRMKSINFDVILLVEADVLPNLSASHWGNTSPESAGIHKIAMSDLRDMKRCSLCHGSGKKHIKSMIFGISVTQNHLIHVTEVVLTVIDIRIDVEPLSSEGKGLLLEGL